MVDARIYRLFATIGIMLTANTARHQCQFGCLMIRALIGASILLGSLVIAAEAQNCRQQYPSGPSRFQCKAARHPEIVEKKEMCRDEARAMGFFKAKKDPAFKDYVHACMHR